MSHAGFNNLYSRLVDDKSITMNETMDLLAAMSMCAELECQGAWEELASLRQHILELKEEIDQKADLIWAVCKDSSGNKVLRKEINMAYEVYKREIVKND